jgi:stringent starvation protein B
MSESGKDSAPPAASTKPYFVRALYEWCTDNGFTPYITVVVDGTTRVPNEFVKDGQIVLNISFDATSGLKIANDGVSFAARFGGVAREIMVPIERVAAIYARENGHGMGFEVTEVVSEHKPDAKVDKPAPATAPERPPRGKPKFTVVK